MFTNVDFNLLPKTFQPAITVAREWFGCRYMWIDSVCIIQDDMDDWERQASLMGSTYAYSKVNIAATCGSNSHNGCFATRDTESARRCMIAAPPGS